MDPQTYDVLIFSGRRGSLEVPTLSPGPAGPAFRPESFFDGPEARRGPRAENSQKPPRADFSLRRDHAW
eukprot:2074707-Pyramimonas_sp.AAC.1